MPVFDAAAVTDDWYSLLPEVYRVADDTTERGGTPLLRFLDLLGAQADEVWQLHNRIEALGFANTAEAPAGWLPWLLQAVGARVAPGASVDDQRAAMGVAYDTGWDAGTERAIAAAAGAAFVDTPVRATGTPWTIVMRVRSELAPTPQSVLVDRVIAAGAKPAGFVLQVAAYTPPWSALEGTWQTPTDLAGPLGSWRGVDTAGL